jgi:exodeoxyribonuclease V gamma subunit
VLHVHRAERADGLVTALGDLLAEPLPDPMTPEVVSVPTRGMERWLAQTLSTRLGVCANVDFPPPGRVVRDAVAVACGVDPDADPWRAETSAWTLLTVVEEQLDEAWLAPLKRYLGEPDDVVRRARRFGVVRHLAQLFDRYALHRPELVRSWTAGDDSRWQAELWRQLRARIGEPGPAERLEQATEVLREQTGTRMSLFGLTRLPAGHLRVLEALAVGRDVHLFLLHPSPALWESLRGVGSVTLRRDDPTALTPTNPLLASWGRDSRELQLVLAGTENTDHHHPVEHPVGTQLAALQAAIRDDTAAPATTRDGSLEVHSCHGRARQVEVLRDAILRTLAADKTLEPRDVIVMCPDIEAFAPLIQATFGATEDGPDLRVRLADRSLRQTNPVLGVVAALLDLAAARVTASEVLDLADREPVRRRFGFSDDDLARLQEWIAGSGTRWGLDADHREPWRVNGTDTGTWRFGLDRVLAGVTMTEDGRRLVHGILPLDDVDSVSIALAGGFAEFLDRLQATVDAFTAAMTAAEWAQALTAAADAFTRVGARDAWQRSELDGICFDLAEHGGDRSESLGLTEVRRLLADRLQGRPTRANFRTGHLTACTLVPMRSVPHRVVCLLGLDDGVFPRKARRDGDDLTLAEPHIGERDPRAEDRQLLLDALLAAQDKLIITYAGRDERTNAVKPPAVPIGELLDLLEDGHVIEHPLQPFDPRNFNAAAPLSFDRPTLAGARALRRPRSQPQLFLTGPLPPVDDGLIELDDLVRFAEHPVRGFLRRRLGLDLRDFTEEVEDGLSIELDGLGRYGLGQRMLMARLSGVSAAAAREAELRGGQLPPGALGRPLVDDAVGLVERLVEAAGEGGAGTVDVRVKLPDGRELRGTVPGVRDLTLRTVSFATLAARHRIAAWVRLLALCAYDPGAGYHARTIGKRGNGIAVKEIAPLEDALTPLAGLLALYDRGLREPLPLAAKTSAAYADGDNHSAARKEWETQFTATGERWEKEAVEPEYQQVFGAVLSYDELAARPGFHDRAHELWDPIREHES